MIRIENLYKKFKEHDVLKGLDLSVEKGEIYGFIGHNGAGKSTTMKILTGLIRYQSGKCMVNGKDIKKHKQQIIMEVGFLPEDPKFYPYMTAIEYLEMIGQVGGNTKKEAQKRIEYLLELTNLKHAAKRRVGGYSRGMKQRLGMASTLYHDPELLILDEPSSALDPEGRKEVLNIIQYLKDQGKTVFLSTHILSDVERVCDRIGMLQGGRIIIEDNIDSLMKEYVLPVYDIEFYQEPTKENLEQIEALTFVDKISINKENVSIFIKDNNGNKVKLFKEVSEMNLPVISYNLRKSSLEEIFMKVVKIDE